MCIRSLRKAYRFHIDLAQSGEPSPSSCTPYPQAETSWWAACGPGLFSEHKLTGTPTAWSLVPCVQPNTLLFALHPPASFGDLRPISGQSVHPRPFRGSGLCLMCPVRGRSNLENLPFVSIQTLGCLSHPTHDNLGPGSGCQALPPGSTL